ncbi:MAG: hypothetical protein AB7U63_03760 [Porticoccaceae bacterium]
MTKRKHDLEDIGHLVPMDELLTHQIVDTFSAVHTPDHGWTEKIWTTIQKKDGSMVVNFGLGRYHNRGILDGFGGVSRNREQWTVRASREVRDDPTITDVGPLRYEIIEPLHKVRYVLEKNDVQPIAFDVTFTSEMPAFLEDRHRQREKDGFRVGSDLIRYHQCGVPSGWVEIEGERIEINPDEWVEFRDHSWGVRLDVGHHNGDIRPSSNFGDAKFGEGNFVLIWAPFMLQNSKGETVSYQFYYQSKNGKLFYLSAYKNFPDGGQEKIARVRPELRYDDCTRRLLGGRIHLDLLAGGTETLEVEVPGEAGFHLGTALYLGFDGKKHGSWYGEGVHLDGEKIDDTSDVKTLKRIHQLRDCMVKVRCGDMEGYGDIESIVHGEDKELGLTAANSII